MGAEEASRKKQIASDLDDLDILIPQLVKAAKSTNSVALAQGLMDQILADNYEIASPDMAVAQLRKREEELMEALGEAGRR